VVDKDDRKDTPIFLLATAGMRLLPKSQQEALLANTCSYLQNHSRFQLPDCDIHVRVIPGETEGLYGWIAANYLLGGFDKPEKHDHGKGHSTYGFLDMGGASAQIAFAPNTTEAQKHADDLKLLRLRKVNGQPMEYGVFVTTWLGFGANEARRRYIDHLLESYPDQQELPDPCLPKGLRIKVTDAKTDKKPAESNGKEPMLLGSGLFAECLDSTYPLLEKTKACTEEPCLLNGVHTPAIDFDVNHFVGVSEYWHTTHEIFSMAHKDRAYDFHTYSKQVSELCARDWESIESDVAKEKWGRKVDKEVVEEVCFKASWLINMLHDGIGIPRMGKEHIEGTGGGHSNKTNEMLDEAEDRGFLDPFQAVDEIDGTEVSWTLGKMILYASSQMPPADGAMPVGFGSNLPGKDLPADFQFPSGKHEAASFASHESTDDADGGIAGWTAAHRLPGIILIVLILSMLGYFLFGRLKSTSVWQKATGRPPSRSHSPRRPPKRRKGPMRTLSSKLFGATEPAYERVLEDADDGSDVELAETSDEKHLSDSSSGGEGTPRLSRRVSNWNTPPAIRPKSADAAQGSPKITGYFDNISSTSCSTSNPVPAVTPGRSPFERGGLMIRAESSDRIPRLSPHNLRRSRTGSPRRSPLQLPPTPFKENVD